MTETLKYDRRVVVKFQENAWCDEDVMKFWVWHCWKPACEGDMHLIYDIHRAQTTEAVQKILNEKCNTHITLVPGMYQN